MGGRTLVSQKTLALLTHPWSVGKDPVIGGHSRFGLGMMLDCRNFPFLSVHAYGHYGISGSVVFNDPTKRLTVSYLTNWFRGENARDRRVQSLLRSLAATLGTDRKEH